MQTFGALVPKRPIELWRTLEKGKSGGIHVTLQVAERKSDDRFSSPGRLSLKRVKTVGGRENRYGRVNGAQSTREVKDVPNGSAVLTPESVRPRLSVVPSE